jgi:hypothetical protein
MSIPLVDPDEARKMVFKLKVSFADKKMAIFSSEFQLIKDSNQISDKIK